MTQSTTQQLQQLQEELNASNAALESFMQASRAEAEMAAHLFYNYILSDAKADFRGLDTYLKSKTDFCGDLILARYSPSASVFVLHVDAMGQGLSATVTLLPVMDIFQSMVDKGYSLPMIMRRINIRLHHLLPPDRFVAASLIEVDLLHQQVSVWNGGMPSIYLLSQQGEVLEEFSSQHLALGILDNSQFNAGVKRFALPESGGLFATSDGLIEQSNPNKEIFGVARLKKLLHQDSLHFVSSRLVAYLKEFTAKAEFNDDLSFYCLNFKELTQHLLQQVLAVKNQRNLQDIHPFTWELTLKGTHLAEQEIANQCNNLLQQMSMPQAVCQRAFTVISELSTNAIDHGILGLESTIKNFADGFASYYTRREQLIAALTPSIQLRIKLKWSLDAELKPNLNIEIHHTGSGFDYKKVLNKTPEELSGRGLMLVKSLTSTLEFFEQGRLVQARLKLT